MFQEDSNSIDDTQYESALKYYDSTLSKATIESDHIQFVSEFTSHKKFEIMCILLERVFLNSGWSRNCQICFILNTILKDFSLDPSDLLLLARKTLLNPKITIEKYRLIEIFVYEVYHGLGDECRGELRSAFHIINTEDRIKLFLDIFSTDTICNHKIFPYFAVFDTNHPSSKILTTFKTVYNPVLFSKARTLDYPDENTIEHIFSTIVVPALERLPIPSWAHEALTFIKNYRAQHVGSEGALPTTNMIRWLVWACANMTFYTSLCQAPEQDSEEKLRTRKITNVVLTRALKEILQFASPQGRYTLTTTLLNNLSDHKTGLEFSPYVQINQGGSNPTLLVSIPLAEIINPMIAPEEDPKKKRAIIEQVKTMVALIPLGQCPGRHYRTIVNTLLVLAEDQTLQPHEKLALIDQIVKRGIFTQVDQLLRLLNNPEGEADYLKTWASLQVRNPALIQKLQETLDLDVSFKVLSTVEYRALIRNHQRKFMQGVVPTYFKHLKESDFKRFLSDFILLQGLSNLGKLPDIYGAGDDFETKCRDIFKELFDLEDHHFTHYMKTVVNYRNSAGLLTYLSKIQSLNAETGQAVLVLFKKFVKALLSENHQGFYALRYAMQDNPHMQALFSKKPALQEPWKEGMQYDFEPFIKDRAIVYTQYQPDLSSLIYKKIFGHNHLDPQYYNHLKDYIEAKNPEEKEQAKKHALEHKASFLTQSSSMHSETDEAKHANIQMALIELLETPLDHDHVSTHHYEPALKILRNIHSMLYQFRPRPQFLHDVEGIINGLKSNFYPPKNNAFNRWKIIDTDHPWDLFMAGTDVEGSCQAIDGDPDLNQCLMAYVMDPKNRMLAIQDKDGTTLARCILRLLVDDEDEPVLFMEEIYPDNARSDFKAALQAMALERASALALPLLSLESTPESYAYPSPVHSHYSPAPTEYVDALYGDQEDGEFTIPAPQCLFDPRLQLKEQRQADHNLANAPLPAYPKPQFLTFEWDVWQSQYHETWQRRYHERYPKRESQGYGPSAMIVRR